MLLSEYKKLYETNASNIDNWKKISMNDLCNNYIIEKENNSKKANDYLSAIICRCWSLMNKVYYKQQCYGVTEFDCYDNMIDSILYVLNSKIWLNPNSKLYKDPNGPYKALSITLKSRRGNIQYLNNMDKRKINTISVSLDALEENSSDSYYIPYYDSTNCSEQNIIEFISKIFYNKQYLKAIILDAIMYYDICDDNKEFSEKKLRHFIYMIDNTYELTFANFYQLSLKEVKLAVQSIKNLSTLSLKKNIVSIMQQLKVNNEIKNLLK